MIDDMQDLEKRHRTAKIVRICEDMNSLGLREPIKVMSDLLMVDGSASDFAYTQIIDMLLGAITSEKMRREDAETLISLVGDHDALEKAKWRYINKYLPLDLSRQRLSIT